MSCSIRASWVHAGGKAPEHWSFTTIEKLLETPKSVSVGVMYPGKDTLGGVPLIKVSDVKNGSLLGKPDFCISPEVDEEYKRTRLNGTELLITLVGNPGDCVLVTGEMKGWNAARALAVVRLREPELCEWLRYVLLSKPSKHLIDSRLNTTVQKTLNLKDVKELPIPIPPTVEREQITKTIRDVEKRVNLNNQINQTLEQMAQTLFKSWFVDFDPVKAKMNGEQPKGMDAATASLFPEKLVESELGLIPEGWDVSPLSNYINIKHGYAFKGTYFSDKETDDICVTPGNFRIGGGIKLDKLKYYDGPIPDGYTFTKGDLMVTMTDLSKQADTLGYPAFVPESASKTYLHNQRVGKVELKTEQDIKNYLYSFFCSSGYRNEVLGGVTGSTVKHTAPKKIMAIEVALDLVVADKFSQLVAPLFEKKAQNLAENSYLEKLRDTLLPKLLSGEIDLENLQVEQAIAIAE